MKTLLITALALFVLFFSSLPKVHAQTQIIGSVADANGQPLPAATILLLNGVDSSLVKGQIGGTDGAFVFDQLVPGDYRLRVSALGLADFVSDVFSLNNQPGKKDLGAVRLQEDAALLAEAQVVAKRPFLEQKIDRTVVNVTNSITNAGGTALQVLQRSPGVQVNQLSKSLSLNGKEGVVVMINGKISRLPSDALVDMLSGMNADNIDRIELIHTPPANFDAESSAGIINIILKSSGDEGLNGGYSAKAGYGRGEKFGAGLYFNYRKNRLNWFGSYDYDHNLNPQVFTNYRGVWQDGDFLETSTYSDRPHTPTGTQNARLGADFQISPKTVVGVLGTFFDRNWYMEAENDVTYLKNGAVESRLVMPNTETNHSRSLAGNINLAHQFTSSQSLNLDADFVQYDINNPSNYTLRNLDADGNFVSESGLRIGKKTPIQVLVAKADYSINFGEGLKLETGGKMTTLRFDNDVRVENREPQQDWTVMPDLTSLSHLNENVAAAYFSFTSKIDAKTDLKGGLRYEFTNTNLGTATQPNVVDREYGSWFPSIFIGRKLTDKQSLNLSYSRRISRPQIRQLAPWLIFIDPTTLQGGNPAIQPSFTDALKLDYSLQSWRFSLSYSIEHDPMRYVPMVDPVTNVQINRPDNLERQRTAGANLYFPLHPTKWWEMQNNFYVSSTDIDFELEGQKFRLQNVNYGFNSTQTFTLPRHFSLEISGNYDAPGYWGIAYWEATGSLNVGIEKNFGEKWGKLRFNATDLLESTNWYGTTRQPDINLYTDESFQMAERTFVLSWTNTFGNKKLKSQRQRQTGAAEEMNRI